MKIAIFGDTHGHWRDFRDALVELNSREPLELALQCGDAQPIRNQDDLEYMHCPKKYRKLGDFWMFHDGAQDFPVPLLFIGGNHEPWNYLDENREGGLLALNIDWPYPISRRKQATYFNSEDIDKALGFGRTDILLLHEWPSLMNDARDESWPTQWGTIGCEHLTVLVELLTPKYVFCAHMHIPAQYRKGRTNIVCLSDFHRHPENAYTILDTSNWNCEWPRIENMTNHISIDG